MRLHRSRCQCVRCQHIRCPAGWRRKARPSYDDLQEAYEEAAAHLETLSGNGAVAPHERAAYRVVAQRIRRAAKNVKVI